MTRVIISIFLILQIPFFMAAQIDESFEIQNNKIDANSNPEIRIFYKKFNSWIKAIGKDSIKLKLNEEIMINNFIIFSEDGLIMKDLNFHSVESCKKQILDNVPRNITDKEGAKWIYITLESHVNKGELIEILTFLKEQKIDYKFGIEDEFVPKIMKN